MARPKLYRKMLVPPEMQGFMPYGMHGCETESVKLLFEEYESIKLLDYELLTQEQASERMNVSRPTLTRIYEKARRTIAKAFIEGKAIVIEGGNVEFVDDWYRCKKCFKLIQGIENHTKCANCTMFANSELMRINKENEKKD